uniref:Putative secreted protein n=1 Tax=Ixodes ricinus TaxID=34613 RepID=A0A6B0U5N1_IXORI
MGTFRACGCCVTSSVPSSTTATSCRRAKPWRLCRATSCAVPTCSSGFRTTLSRTRTASLLYSGSPASESVNNISYRSPRSK